jgi:type IV pilus assembly protein PilF
MGSFFRVAAVAAALCLSGAAWAQTPSASSDAEARFNAGLTHLRDGRPKLAVEEFQRAIKQDPKNPYFHKGLGLAYATLTRFDDAVGAFRKALELNPYYTDVRNDLGMALMLAGNAQRDPSRRAAFRQQGKAEFLAAFNDPTNPTPEISARNLGEAYFEEGNHAEAANWYRSSLNRNKAYPDAYLGLAAALVALGRAEEAIATLETGATEVPASTAIQLSLGEAYYRAGRFADARARLEDARKKDPSGADARRAAELLKHFPK